MTDRTDDTPLKAPAIFNIEAQHPFLDRLVAGIFARVGMEPAALARCTILLPARRACRSLREAFLRQSGGRPLLLPRMMAVGDMDSDEILMSAGDAPGADLDLLPAIEDTRRQLLLALLVRRWSQRSGTEPILPGQAAALARDLARLLDQAQAEELSLEGLEKLVPEELAGHWQESREFLSILHDQWPNLLQAEQALDPSDRLNKLVRAQLAVWREAPPSTPIIAAGFAAAPPATADLLTLVSLLPQSAVVLPGVDCEADEALWTAIGKDPTHPQHGLHRLLAHLGAPHDSLPPWTGSADTLPSRASLIREIMRPAGLTEQWNGLSHTRQAGDGAYVHPKPPPLVGGRWRRGFPQDGRDAAADRVAPSSRPPPIRGGGDMLRQSLWGLSRIDCADPQEEAVVVALLLRERLERPDATAMLVTPDRGLARRVAAELRRWRIDIDDSGGIPLNQTPPGVFLRLVLEAAAEALAPVPLLALLKHPLAACGTDPAQFRAGVRDMEKAILRGVRPLPGLAGLAALAGHVKSQAPRGVIEALTHALEPFLDLMASRDVALDRLIQAHLTAAEALARTHEAAGAERLWSQEAGEAAATLMTELIRSAQGFGSITGGDYPALFEALIAGRVVRPRFGKHPRLQILGALEARLQQADLVILGGLNETVWPATPGHDPWMSRPMREKFGLRALETAIGLAAHDFVSAFSAPETILTRSLKAEGAPTVPSRWLLRLDTVLRAIGGTLPQPKAARHWAVLLDHPETLPAPCPPPAPRPAVALRPRELSVTAIETWRRDPYAIYARHILKLRALDPLDADPGAAEKGEIIHRALDLFVRNGAGDGDPLEALMAYGRTAFADDLDRPGVWAFWWPRFERIARWFLDQKDKRRDLILESLAERRGSLVLDMPYGAFTLTARADRIDRLRTGCLAIIDYKTGAIPTVEAVKSGYAPQMALEAVIASSEGFEDVAAAMVSDLAFWKLSGGDPAGEICPAGGKNAVYDDLASDALQGLEALIALFDDAETPYLACPRPSWAPRFNDYGHLARIQEWSGTVPE